MTENKTALSLFVFNNASKSCSEFSNYFFYSLSSGSAFHSLRALALGLHQKYKGSKIMPPYQVALHRHAIQVMQKKKGLSLPLSYSVDSDLSPLVDHLQIRLATMPYDMQGSPSWDFIAEDPEDTYSLHRFEWLLPALTSRGASKLVPLLQKVILSWIDENRFDREKPGWDSYSISERCVNWLYLISRVESAGSGCTTFIQRVNNSLTEQVQILGDQLEFRGSSTNNHLINNARALYLTGSYLQDMEVAQIGRSLASVASGTMFSQSGFLREGSSHYHILLCRTYLELYWMAQHTGDSHFLEILTPHVGRLLRASFFFMTEKSLPLIGDVSPDYATSFHFLACNPQTSNDESWYLLFKSRFGEFASLQESVEGLVSFPDAGFYRFKNDNYAVFIYVNPLNHIPAWSHAHADVGGFVMYWKNEPFLVDTGRLHYQTDPMGHYGRSVRSHNSISIDDREPMIVHGLNGYPQLMISDYFQPAPDVSSEKIDSVHRLRIEMHGFARYIRGAKIVRVFSFFNTHLRIEDQILGEGCHRAETFFHFAPEVKSQMDNGQEISGILDGQALKLRAHSTNGIYFMGYQGTEVPSPAGWHCPEYGQALPTSTFVNLQKKTLPICNRYDVGVFSEA